MAVLVQTSFNTKQDMIDRGLCAERKTVGRSFKL